MAISNRFDDGNGSSRLGKLIRLLASDKSGEVIAAASAINRALRSAGLDIHRLAEVVERSPLIPEQTPPPPDGAANDWHPMREFCLERRWMLRSRELEFVISLQYWRYLTPKQRGWLTAIYERLQLEP